MTVARIQVTPEVIRWARERANLSSDEFVGNLRKVSEWESGESLPTLRQLRAYARKTHAAFS